MTKDFGQNLSRSRRKFLSQFGALAGSGVLGLSLARIAWGAQSDSSQGAPLRLICYSFPNGCQHELWNYDEALKPLAGIKNQVHVFRGLRNQVVESFGGDGHEQGGVSLFTGGVSTNGETSTRPSLDTVVGAYANSTVLKRPFVAGVSLGAAGGSLRTLSWRRRSWDFSGKPNSFQQNPLEVLNALFADTPDPILENHQKNSLIHSAQGELGRLLAKPERLSGQSKVSLDLHLTRLTELQRKLQATAVFGTERGVCSVINRSKITESFEKNFELSYAAYENIFESHASLLVSAMHCDFVRTGSLMFGNSGDDYFSPQQKYGDHDTSHYFNPETELAYKAYRRLHIQNLLKLIETLRETTDFDGSPMLDNTIVLVGSEFGDGRAHVISPQPHLIIGGQRFLTQGKEWDFELTKTPSHLYASIEKLFRSVYLQGPEAQNSEENFREDPLEGLLKA